MRKAMCRITIIVGLVCVLQFSVHAQWTWTPQTGRWINVKHLPKETAELQLEYARSLMLAHEYKQALEETDKFSDYYSGSEFDAQNQFLRGEIKMAQGHLTSAAKEFQQVVSKYPNSPLFDDVIAKQYEIGDQLYQEGEKKLQKHWRPWRKRPFKRAIEVYSMVISNQPFTDAAAEAQYKVGLCHHTRKEYIEAAYEYKRVIEDYSASQWVDEACFGLAKCYCDSSLPAEYDQQPSQLAVSAIDDFKQRFPTDSRVAELDEKRVKLRETIALQKLNVAKFYERRRNFASARIYYELLAREFEDTPSAETARKWLEDNPVTEVSAADRVLLGKQTAQ